MNIEIKSGSLSDFFSSAKETAKEIDLGERVTRKDTFWVGKKVKLEAVLAKIKDNEPDEQDKL